jgi:hypothetical protein
MNKINKITTLLLIILSLSCAKKNPEFEDEKVRDTNPFERARQAARDGGGIFGDINQNKKSSTTFDFATSNALWRATLQSLDFLPLINADYSGGIIIYDWYSQELNSNEQIKISIKFLSNEIRSDSIQVSAHKKICNNNEKCITSKIENNLTSEIKDKILFNARAIKLEESKKEKR